MERHCGFIFIFSRMSFLRIKCRMISVCCGFITVVSIISICHQLWLLCGISEDKKPWKNPKEHHGKNWNDYIMGHMDSFTKESSKTREYINYYSKYTYDEPSSYNGVILESWPPSKNRSIKEYINYNFTHHPGLDKLFNTTLLIMVQSRPSEKDYRDNWRVVVKSKCPENVAVVFILGKDENFSVIEERELLNEIYRYQDIVQVNELIEDYHNLTLKSLYSLKFFLSDDLFPSGTIPKYLLKVDLDVYVHTPLFI